MSIAVPTLSDWYGGNIVIYEEMTKFVKICELSLPNFNKLKFTVRLIEPGYYSKVERDHTYLSIFPIDPDKRHRLPNYDKKHEILEIKVETTYNKFNLNFDKFFDNIRVTSGGHGNIMVPWYLCPISEPTKYGIYKTPKFDELYQNYLQGGWRSVYESVRIYNRKIYRDIDTGMGNKLTESAFLNELRFPIVGGTTIEKEYCGPKDCISTFMRGKYCHIGEKPQNPNCRVEIVFLIITIDIEYNTEILIDLFTSLLK